MGRREQRAELRASWHVFEPRVPGVPMTKKDLEDAEERASAGEPLSPEPSTPLDGQTRESVNGTLQRPPSDLLALGMLGRLAR